MTGSWSWRVFALFLMVLAKIQFACPRSWAVEGTYLAPKEAPGAVCEIFSILPDGSGSECSAVLVGERRLITDAHCLHDLPQKSKMQIRCVGGIGYYNAIEDTIHGRYSEIPESIGHPPSEHDIAVIDLAHHPTGVKPLRMVLDRNEALSLVQTGKCSIWGYGVDNEQLVRTLHGASFHWVETRTWKHNYPDYIQTAQNLADAGDSGGPVLCKDDHGKWVVVAVTSSAKTRRDIAYDENRLKDIRDHPSIYFSNHLLLAAEWQWVQALPPPRKATWMEQFLDLLPVDGEMPKQKSAPTPVSEDVTPHAPTAGPAN